MDKFLYKRPVTDVAAKIIMQLFARLEWLLVLVNTALWIAPINAY